jgi:hypothetical protein
LVTGAVAVAIIGGGLLVLVAIIVALGHAGRQEAATYPPAPGYSLWDWAWGDKAITDVDRLRVPPRTFGRVDGTATYTEQHTPDVRGRARWWHLTPPVTAPKPAGLWHPNTRGLR